MTVVSGAEAEIRVGNCLPLANIPVGTQVHNIELLPGKGGQLARSAGMSAQLMAKEGKICNTSSSIRRDENGSDQLPCNCWSCRKWRP